jgi:hypothetical protein
MSIGVISRNIRAQKQKNSGRSRGRSPTPSHAKRRKPAKRLFTFVFVSNSLANGRSERIVASHFFGDLRQVAMSD